MSTAINEKLVKAAAAVDEQDAPGAIATLAELSLDQVPGSARALVLGLLARACRIETQNEPDPTTELLSQLEELFDAPGRIWESFDLLHALEQSAGSSVAGISDAVSPNAGSLKASRSLH